MKLRLFATVCLSVTLAGVVQARQRKPDLRRSVPGNVIEQRQNVLQRGWGHGSFDEPMAAGPAIHEPFTPPMTARKIRVAIDDALHFLRSQQQPDGSIGRDGYVAGGPTALAALAMLAAGADPLADPTLKRALEYLLTLNVDNTYVRAVRANVWEYALRKVPHEDKYRQALKADFDWLLGAMHDRGWRYTASSRDWDNSCTQYGVLGLWAANRAGFDPGEKFWRTMSEHFRRYQNEDGGWGYVEGSGSTPNMATAGLASMFLVFDNYHGKKAWRAGQPDAFKEGDAAAVLASLERGMKWLGASEGDKENSYYLYGIERTGVASGRKYFGGEDWFRRGALAVLERQAPDGATRMGYGDTISTAFTTLFLVYGGAPVAFNKLQHGEDQDWNLNPRDVANVARELWSAYERPLNWHIVGIDDPVEEYEAPVLFISGSKAARFSEGQVARLREYVLRGGTILAEPADGSAAFRESMGALLARMFPPEKFPGRTLKPLAADHGVYTALRQTWQQRPKLSGASDGTRTFFLLSEGYLAADWQMNEVESDAFRLATNLLFYATDLGTLEGRFASPLPETPAADERGQVRVARARFAAQRDADLGARAWAETAAYVQHVTGLAVQEAEPVDLARPVPGGVHLLHLSGREALTLTDAELAHLKAWIAGGGTLLVDAWGGSPAFADSARRLVAEHLGPLSPLDPAHPLAVGRFDGGGDLGRVRLKLPARRVLRQEGAPLHGQQLEVVRREGRLAVVFSRFDLSAALAGVEIHGRLGYEADGARRIVANLAGWIREQSKGG